MSNSTALGITGFSAYIPKLRLDRKAIAKAHHWMAPTLNSLAKGERSFCNWDEDAITMAVAAAQPLTKQLKPNRLLVSSTTMPFEELQGSAVVAGALQLPSNVRTLDAGNTTRAATSAMINALSGQESSLLIASDCLTATPASIQEMRYGAGAAALTLGRENPVATLLANCSEHAFFVDHFRSETSVDDYYWEERWIRDEGYKKILARVIQNALSAANLTGAAVDHFIVPSSLKDPTKGLLKQLGIAPDAVSPALAEHCGYIGSAHALLMLVNVLEQAKPGEVIVVTGFGQGADVLVLRTTDALQEYRKENTVDQQLADGIIYQDYLRMLSYQGKLKLDFGMRSERATKTALTEQYRSSQQLTPFNAGLCSACGTIQFPQLVYCVNPQCNAPHTEFEPYSLADKKGQVLTCTADWLTYHPAPPLYAGFVEFEGGGRLLMEFSDVLPTGIDVGQSLEMAFRIKDVDKQRGYPRYFWKAVPLLSNETHSNTSISKETVE